MAENQVLTSAGEEKELSELLQIRRDKLSALVAKKIPVSDCRSAWKIHQDPPK